MKKLLFDSNTTQLTVSSGGQFVSGFNGVVNGDSVLFASHFTEVIGNANPTDLDLTDPGAPLSLRLTIRGARDTDARLWGFQSAFNQGNYTTGENLPEGRVTWLVSLGDMAYPIVGVTASTFVIDGDFVLQIIDGDTFSVSGSTGNDGDYTVDGTPVYSSGSDETTITVIEIVPDLTVDGDIDHSALNNDLIIAGVTSPGAAVSGFVECALLDSNSIPQTLMQLPISIVDELDDGANAVSAAARPTYLTAVEQEATYLHRGLANWDTSELSVLVGGVLTVTQTAVRGDTQAAAAADDMDTITIAGVVADNMVVIRLENSARIITIKHGTGNITTPTGADIVMDNGVYVFWYDGTNFLLNGAGSGSGTGDVVGPGSSTDHAIARYDLTTGKILLDSAVFIDDSGNLGVGIAVPTKPLDVRSEARVWNGTEGVEMSFSGGNTSGIIGSANTSGNFEIRTNMTQTARIFLANAGNVGINENSPAAQLHSTSSSAGKITFQLEQAAAQTADSLIIVDSSAAELTSIDSNGTPFLHAEASAPADGEFQNSQWTLWLDESNDEFELKAKKSGGAVITQTIGSGGGGGFTFVKVTGTGTASDLDEVGADTSGGAYTYNLPASPTANMRVRFMDIAETWDTNNLTVGRNSETIRGAAADFICDVEGSWIEFVYNGTDSDWEYRTI